MRASSARSPAATRWWARSASRSSGGPRASRASEAARWRWPRRSAVMPSSRPSRMRAWAKASRPTGGASSTTRWAATAASMASSRSGTARPRVGASRSVENERPSTAAAARIRRCSGSSVASRLSTTSTTATGSPAASRSVPLSPWATSSSTKKGLPSVRSCRSSPTSSRRSPARAATRAAVASSSRPLNGSCSTSRRRRRSARARADGWGRAASAVRYVTARRTWASSGARARWTSRAHDAGSAHWRSSTTTRVGVPSVARPRRSVTASKSGPRSSPVLPAGTGAPGATSSGSRRARAAAPGPAGALPADRDPSDRRASTKGR